MARPARKVEDPNIEGQDDTNTQALDEASQEEQTHRTGQVAQGDDDLIQTLAKRAGWKDKDQWDRDPSKWTPAAEYLEASTGEVEALRAHNRQLKEQQKRAAQAASDAIEETRRQARNEAQAEVRAAAEAGDPERAEAAAKRLASTSGPPPQTVAWMGENSWFNEDPRARSMAVFEINRLAESGASIEDQLAGAKDLVKRGFPEHFGEAKPGGPTEVSLAESRHARTPPAVSPGTRGTDVRTKEKTFGDIPSAARYQYNQHFAKRFQGQGLTAQQAEAKYAASYWRNQGEA